VAGSSFYDAGLIKQVAVNLFYGWGYNFYRQENQLRADDQLIRAKASTLLGQAVASLSAAEDAYRREFLPPPSRAAPFPNAAAVAQAQSLERLGRSIAAIESRLHAMPVPQNDRMTQRYRQEAPTLEALAACDEQLIGKADLLRTLIQTHQADWIVENLGVLEEGLASLQATLQARQAILLEPSA